MAPFAPTSDPRPGGRAIIERVRLCTGGAVDPAWARLRLEGLLDSDLLRSPELPPSSVLCIRALRDPSPGTLTLERDGRWSGRWKGALQRAIAEAARSAARPIDAGVPAAATAVLFRDRAELLACLARDWLRGDLATHWWWDHLVRRPLAGRVVPAEWAAYARYVPAAAALLAERHALLAFVAALERAELTVLVERVAEVFGAPPVSENGAALDRSPWPDADGNATRNPPSAAEAALRRANPVAFTFLELSLRLARAGAANRSIPMAVEEGRSDDLRPLDAGSGYTGAAMSLDQAPGSVRESPPTLLSTDAAEPAPRASRNAEADRLLQRTSADHDERAIGPGGGTQGGIALARDAVSSKVETASGARRAIDAPLSVDTRMADVHAPEQITGSPPSEPAEARPLSRAGAATSRGASQGAEDLPRPAGSVVITRYGGVFFLVNVLLALGVYGDFAHPRSRMVGSSPWRLVVHLARALLGDDLDSDDALWALLDALGASPADASEVWPADWRVEPEWLEAFPSREGWTSQARGGRLRVSHPAGLVVLDIAVDDGQPAQRLEHELKRYGATAASWTDALWPHEAWPDLLAGFVRARLKRALAPDHDDVGMQSWLGIPARVHVTDAHVDVRMSLADLPIEIRLAGLDRDPGWVPAAGRFIAFHFD